MSYKLERDELGLDTLANILTALLSDPIVEPVKFPASAPDYAFSQSLFKLKGSNKEIVMAIHSMGVSDRQRLVDVEFRFSENLLNHVVSKQIPSDMTHEDLVQFAAESSAMLELFTDLDTEEV